MAETPPTVIRATLATATPTATKAIAAIGATAIPTPAATATNPPAIRIAATASPMAPTVQRIADLSQQAARSNTAVLSSLPRVAQAPTVVASRPTADTAGADLLVPAPN